MGADLAADVMMYIREFSPFILIFGGIIFADLVTDYLVRLVKQARGSIRW